MLKQFMPKTNTAVQKSDVYHFDALYKFNGKYYVKKSFGDTIYQINKEHINPCFILSERDLKIPVQIATDLSKKKERSRYIYGESGYLISNYYFSSYYYQNMCYQDVWNLETSSLICRNLIKSQESRKGVPFFIEEKMIYVWPKFVAENYLYCIIPAEEIQAIIPNLQDDSNPCILEMKID
jgi:hypothetical protein